MKTLEDVAKFLETHNWGQGLYYNKDDDSYCLFGAMFAVTGWDYALKSTGRGPENYDVETYHALVKALYEKPHAPNSLMIWNDEPGRTKEEVIALLRS